jgi:hypothetical protein
VNLVILLTLAAFGQAVSTSKSTAESETMAQLRHDLFGEQIVPVYQFIRFDSQTGNTQFVGYAGLGAVSGLDNPGDVDLYSLHARRKAGHGEWVLGRQQATTLRRRQTFDGLRYWWRPNGKVAFDVWGGIARHHDIDDFRDGTGLARAATSASAGPLLLRAGVQVEAGPETEFIARQDLHARVALGRTASSPVVRALVGVAEPDFAVEWARLEVRVPAGPLDVTLHGQHREAADPRSLFGDAILHTLAGGGVNEAGASLRVYGTKWAQFSGGYRLVTYGDGESDLGHAVDVSYLPGRGRGILSVRPRYAFRRGPNGAYHALYADTIADVDDATRLEARAAVVPYRKGHDGWRVALDGGVEGERDLTPGTSIRAGVDIGTDGLFKVDLRAGAAITVRLQ